MVFSTRRSFWSTALEELENAIVDNTNITALDEDGILENVAPPIKVFLTSLGFESRKGI